MLNMLWFTEGIEELKGKVPGINMNLPAKLIFRKLGS